MSQQHIDLWKQTAQAFDQRYQAISADQLGAETPCPDWTVQDLIDHAVGVQQGFTAGMVGADVAEGADWPTVKSALETAIDVEGSLDGMTNHPAFGEVPKTMLLGIAISDLLIHTWDVSRAAGLDESLPAEAVMASYMGMQKMGDGIRSETMFGPAIECAEDADTQTKMLSFAGRQV